MNEQEVSKLYNALLSKGYSTDDLGTAERFAEMMSSADNRKTLYDYVRSRGDFKIGNFDAYERRLAGQPLGEPQGAGGAATQSQHTEPQGAGVAATQSQYTEQQGIDRSPEERMSVARTVAGARAVSGAVGAQQANAERYREGRRTSGQIRLGLGEERPSFFGSNPNVVASQQFNPQTGERETTYLTETGNEYTNKEGAVAEQNYHDAQHRLDKYQTELPVDINADAEERGRQLDAALEENSRRMRELSETRDTEERGFWQMLSDAISMSPTLGGSPTRQWSESDATRDQLKTLGAERDLLEQARRTNAVLRDLRKSDGFFDLNNVTNFVRGVKDEASDIRGMGLRDLFTATALKDIKDKMDRNEPLNDTELSLLAAAGVNSEIQTVAQGEMPHGYTAGVTTAAMAPFMAQLAMVPEGGLGGLFGRYATQMYGKAGLKSLAARAAAKISGDVLTSTILANTVQAPATYADALNRMTGDVTTDENGRVSFVGGESAGDSFRKAITAATIENYTEMAFEGNGGIGKQALTRLADRLGLQGVRNTLGRITRSQALDAVRRFESQVRWGGTIEEALEEELGIVLNSMFVGDNQLSDLVDADQQIDIILGVGVFGGAVSALKSGLYLRQQRNLSRAAEVASARGSVLFGDDRWAGIRARIDDADSDEALQSEISSLIQDPSLDNAQRRAVLEYGARRGAYQGYNYGMQIVRDEMSDTMRAGFDAFQVGMELSGSQLNDAGRTARNAKTFLNGTPDGQSIADAVDALIDAGTREEDVNAYFSSLSEGPSREAALDYFTSMMTLQGAAARMLEDAQAGISQFEADVDAGTATVNGEQAVIVATVDGQQAYVLDDNGSTALVMVDGEKRQVPSSAVENPTTFRPDAYKSQYRESVEQSINDELNFRFNNHANTEMPRVGLELHNGEDTYQIVDVNGATGAVTATRVKIDKNGQLVPDGGALVTLTTQDVLDMQNQYYEGLDARQAGGAATQSQHTEQGAGGAATESRQTGQDVVEAAEQEVLAVSPEGADYIDSIRQLIDSYGSVNESFYDGVPQNLVEPLRRYAEAYAVAAAGLQSTGADAVQAPPAGEPQGTVTDYPRDKDGDLDVDAIRQTGDSQMMSDALRSEFGDEQANAMAQQFLSEAVQVQGKEKNPVKRNGSRQKAVDFWRDVAGRLNTVPAAEPQGTMEKERPKNLSEEELSVYLHNENGELDYGRTNEILDDIDRGLARVGRFSPEEERGRYGKAATASAILQGGVNSRLERQRQDEARTGTPVTVADVLSPSQERDIDAENAEAFNRRYGELISYLKASGLWYNNLDEVLTLTDPSAEEMGRTESRVYLSKDGTSVIKILDLSEQLGGDPAVLSDFITLNNANFPDVALTLLGYMEEDGMLYAVMSQPRIRGTEADTYFKARGIDLDEGIAEALSRIGFTPVEGSKSTFQNDRYYMSDVHGGNIMIDEDGNVYPIDVKLELKDRAQAGDYGVRENRVPESHGTAGDAVRAKWEGAAKIEGNAGSKTLSGGQRIRGRYVLVEEGAATPSHDPSTFRPNEGFPVTESGQNANSRDYENDANAQASVQQMGGAYDGRAVDDTPVVSSEGVVWSGNNRVMSGQLAAQNGTDAGYKEALMDNAAMYGFIPEQVDGMAHPRVYFVPDAGQGLDYTPQTFNLFNAPQQKEEGSVGKGVKMGKVLTDRTFGLMSQIVSDYGSLANIFKSANACRDLVRIMQEAEEIVEVNQQTLPRYLTPDGLLTEDGQNLVNAALVGYMFRDNAEVLGYLERLPKSAIRQMADAMPELVANARMGEYALGAELAEAIKALYQQSESGQSMEDFMRQYDLFAEGGTLYGETTKALIEAMSGRVANATNGTLKDLMSQYNERAADAASGQGDMFSRNSREDILRDVLGLVPAEAATLSQQTEPQEAGASGEENSQNTSEQTNNSLSLQPENERNDGPGKVEDSDGGGDGVDGAHAAASRLLRGISIEPVSERQESGSKERLLAEVEKSARDSGQWFEGIASQLDGYQLSSGGENEVYLANGEITKLNNFAFLRDDATNFEDFLNRIESFNDLFPDVALRLLGFAKNSKGEVCVVMSQPAITNSREATEEEIDAALEDMGFYTDISGEWTDGRYVISDLKPNNVLVDSEGHLHFIDVVTFDDTKPGRMMVPRKPEAEEDAATQSQQTERPEAEEGAVTESQQTEQRDAEGEEKARKAFSDDVTSRMIMAVQTGEKPYKGIVDLRSRAKELGMTVNDRGGSDILLQELFEDGLVRAANQIIGARLTLAAAQGDDVDTVRRSKELFDRIVKLYEMQPTLGARSTGRIAKQQYSTPLPMAYAAGMFAYDERMEHGLEPTAGNGMLTIAVPARKVHVNEIDEQRLENLRGQGFAEVTDQDATQPFEGGRQYDFVIANPPFGSAEEKSYGGKLISGLDPQIALNALESMKDDGKAVIIIGGNMEYEKNGSIRNKKQFFTYLYDRYNVKGVLDMAGGLYQKQGTTYPTRMILIDGRRSDAEREQTTVYPPRESEALPKVETYDDLYRVVTELINSKEKTNGNEVLRTAPRELESDDFGKSRPSEQRPDNRQSGADDTQPGGGGRVGDDLATSPSPGGRSVLGERGQADRAGSERGQHGQPGRVPGQRGESGGDNSRLAQQGGDRRNSGDSDGRVVERDRSGSLAGRDLVSTDESAREKRELGQEKLPYRLHNSAFSLESVAPAAMVESMDASLSEIEKEVGPIDEFVRSELGYDTVEEAHDALAAEQMDSVAMAIYQMKQGQALIIGDQTGVGKGRQMAALIRWAVRQGKKPIFFTKDANLFSDIYRDLVDVGSGDLRPFIFNAASGENPGVMTDNEGKVIYSAPRPSAQAKILAGDSLPDDYDYAVLSYSQVNKGDAKSREEARAAAKSNGGRAKKKDTGTEKPTPKADFLRKIAKDNYLFLDESHTAAGEASNTGAYLQSLVKDAKGVTFASATFAKYPETMPLYALRTAMSKAMIKANELIGIIKKGGVTLQEIMSRALSEGGQMVRRERDMSDVRTDWKTVDDPATVKRARENYDRTIAAFNAIIRFQETYVAAKINELDAQLSMRASSADVKRGTKKMGIDNTPFASKAYNYTKQLLLALKVDAIVDEVESEIKAGRHPVIALDSTMESATKDYSVGEVVSEPSFALSLLRGLDSVMQYTVTDENGKKVSYRYTPADLGPAGEAAYYQLQDFIRKSTKDIFISPIDAIIERLNEKGYKVGELTGRKSYARHDEDGRVRIMARADRDKKRQAREFNSGELDVLILNKSAATGISLHASEKFADQRQRTMIIAQPLGDINDYMQMIGRIDRTGQVHRGYYINLGLPVPAENRFLMMLATKLRSLNANTTTSQESKSNDVEAPDLLNKYGSQVIIEYLRDNPDIYEKMGRPLKGAGGEVGVTQLDEYTPKEDDASRVTGRVALLTTEEQDAFYDDVVKRYNDLIKYLDETGTNDLKITVMPLRAKTLSKKVSSEGSDPSGKNPFAGNAYVEEVEMDVLRKPMTAEDVRKTMAQLNGGNSDGGTVGHSDERVREIKSTIVNETEAKIVAENARYEKAQTRVEEDIEKRTERINASNRTAEEKRQAIEEYAEEHRAEAENDHNERVSRLREQGSNFVRRLGWFDVGQTCMVPDDLTTDTYMFMSPAIFCGYKAKDSKVTPSTTFAVFATLDGRRRVEVKMSQIGALINIKNATENNWDSVRQTTLANWDSRLPKSTRRKGYIMTGNILQAVSDTQDQAGNYPGQLISYTDENGGVHDGILMPEKWTPSQLKTAGAPISSRIEQIKNLRSGEKVVSTDGKVSFSRDWRGTLTLDVPKSKKEGGKYYLNDELLEHVRYNEFNTYRGQMEAVISNSEIEAVVNILSQMGVRVATEEDAATESQQTESRGTEGVRFSVVEPIADFDTRKISEAKTNAEWAEAVTESDNVARAKRRVAPIVEKVAQEYRGISKVIISTGKSFLEELAKDERLSDEDRNDLLAVANGEIEAPNAGYIASIDKIIIFNLGASESEIKSYLCHEIAHRAIRHLALSGRMSDWAEVLERLNPTLAKYVREAYARYGRDAQIPEEVVVHIIEHLVRDYGVEGTRSRLQNLEANNGEKAKGLTSIIDFIEHGRQRENQQAERENQSREGSTEGNAVERDVRARGERYSLLGSEPGSREEEGVAFSLGAVARNSGSARVEYEATVNGMAHRLRETWQDSMLSLKALQDAVTKETGRKLLDTQNAWMAENRLSSMNAAQQEEFRREQMRPLLKAVAALGGAKKREYAEITKYMIAKHGLERNRVFAQRDGITKPKDYSGLTSLFRTGDVQDAERMAQDYVDQFESAHDTEAIDALWDAVRGVSQFALRKSLETGMISEDTFHTLMGQFDYYVPLRGWDEPTSDEVYDYIGRQESPLATP